MPTPKQVTVTDTPTLLYVAQGPQAETVIFDVQSGSTITLGDKTVVAGVGPQYPVSSTPNSIVMNEDLIYAVCPAGLTAVVSVLAIVSGVPV